MNNNEMKCVMIIDDTLEQGMIANISAVLALSLGNKSCVSIGQDTIDASNNLHEGIISTPVPILKGNNKLLSKIRNELFINNSDIVVIDYSHLANSIHNYQEYVEISSKTKSEEYSYLGLALYGPKKIINKYTGSLPLLR